MDKLIASFLTASALFTLVVLEHDQKRGILAPGALHRAHACRTYLDAVGA